VTRRAGVWPLTYVSKYQGHVAAANIAGGHREANYDAVPRVVFTDPQAASVGAPDGPVVVSVPLADVPRTLREFRLGHPPSTCSPEAVPLPDAWFAGPRDAAGS
jgi:hypothetical protein